MNTPETRLKELLPRAFQVPFDPKDPSSIGHQFIDLDTTPEYMETLIRRTIRIANLGVALEIRSRRRVLIFLQAEIARGLGSEGEFITITEAERYSQSVEEFKRDHQLSIVAHLEQRAEVLKRHELLRIKSELWQDSPSQPTILFQPLVNVESFLNHQFNQLNPSRVGILVDYGDKTGITARIQQALIVNSTNLTVVSTNVKERLEDLAERNGLMIRGNYWKAGRPAPKPAYLYQVCVPESFSDTVFRTLRANRELQKMVDRESK